MTKLIRNSIQTPDGTIIESRHRHDYKEYTDANGKTYMVDGGLDYARWSGNGDEKNRRVWSDESFDKIREAVEWGTYGINGDQPLSYVKLCDMDTAHIQACLDTIRTIYPQIRESFESEIEYRKSNES
jgi:hypothetical protein